MTHAEKPHIDLRYLYFRYQNMPVLVISTLVGILLIAGIVVWKMIVPQLETWFSVREEIAQTRKNIQVINANKVLISSLSGETLDNQLRILTQAVPNDKNFTGLMQAIASAAIDSSVGIDDFFLS